MQIVGTHCPICSEKFAIIVGVQSCPTCEVAWHPSCIEEPDTCPKCGTNVVTAGTELKNRKDTEDADVARVGRLIYLGLLASYVIVVVIVTVNAFAANPNHLPFKEAVRLVVFAAIWVAAFRGSSGARKTLGVFAALGLALSLAMFSKIPLLASVIVFHSLFTLWAVWFSPQIGAYEKAIKG